MNIYLKENNPCTATSFTNKHCEESLFKSLFKDNYPNESLITEFPNTFYYSDEDTNADSISMKCDMGYYHALKDIDWDVLLTLKFKKRGFSGTSDSARSNRLNCLWDLKHEVIGELDAGSNHFQYFCAEEVNADKEAHFHVLWHSVYRDKCSTETLRETIMRQKNRINELGRNQKFPFDGYNFRKRKKQDPPFPFPIPSVPQWRCDLDDHETYRKKYSCKCMEH